MTTKPLPNGHWIDTDDLQFSLCDSPTQKMKIQIAKRLHTNKERPGFYATFFSLTNMYLLPNCYSISVRSSQATNKILIIL